MFNTREMQWTQKKLDIAIGAMTAILLCTPAWSVSADPPPTNASLQTTFAEICSAFETSYPFSEAEEKHWFKIKGQLDRDLNSPTFDSSSFPDHINGAFQELGISHLKLHALAESDSKQIRGRGKAHTGIDMAWIEGKWFVRKISEATASEIPALKPGFEITRIDSTTLQGDSNQFPMDWILQSRQAHFGPFGARFEIRGKDLEGNDYQLQGTYKKWEGKWSKSFGNLSSLPIALKSEEIDGVKVIRFNYFVFDILPEIKSILETTPADIGIIIDLRGNPGGMGIMANAIAGKLTDVPFKLGEMQLKGGWIAFFADPQPEAYLGKTAILVDEFSASTSEIFAQGLMEANRAKVFGRTTMGAALPSKFVQITDNYALQIPVATYTSEQGYVIEGQGVKPNQIVIVSRDDLIKQKDPVIFTAIQYLKKPTEVRIK